MPVPMEEGEIASETDQDPSVLEVPAINWARYVGVKSVQYVMMGHAPRISFEEQDEWNLEQAVRETEKNFLYRATATDDRNHKRPQPAENSGVTGETTRDNTRGVPNTHWKLLSRFGRVFLEDKIEVPKNLRTTVISLLHKGHPAISKMILAARHFWWPKMTEAILKKCEACILPDVR